MTETEPIPHAAGPGRPLQPAMAAGATALFLLSAAALLSQVVLTRIYSVLFWYHSAYLLIALGLVGYGLAASVLARAGPREQGQLLNLASQAAAAAAALLTLVLFAAGPLGASTDQYLTGPGGLAVLLAMHLLTAAPFAALGACTAALLAAGRDRFAVLYAADLAGAATGALLAVPLLRGAGAPAALAVAALAAGVAGFILERPATPRTRLTRARAALGVFAPTLLFALFVTLGSPTIPPGVGKDLTRYQDFVEWSRWTEVARVDVVQPLKDQILFGGRASPLVAGRTWDSRMVTQDGTAPTWLYRCGQNVRELDFLDHLTQSAPFTALTSPSVLVLGVGGGIDVLNALYHDARAVTGIEMNQAILDLVQRDYADWIGPPMKDPRVRLLHAEGRNFLERSADRFDLILLSGVDTFSAQAAGAYSLVECTLYTAEAASTMLSRLAPHGLLSVSRRLDESFRWCSVLREALLRRGASEASARNHLFVLYGGSGFETWASAIVSADPLSPDALEALRHFALSRQFRVAFDPGVPGAAGDRIRATFESLLSAEPGTHAACVASFPAEVRPTTDDWPFFFQSYRPGRGQQFTAGVSMLLTSGAQVVVLALLLVLWPVRRGAVTLPRDRRWKVGVFFAAIGAGFMCVEMVLISRLIHLLGTPAASLSLVLAGLLAGAGLGSLLASRRQAAADRAVLWAVPFAVALLAGLTPAVVAAGMAWSWAARCALAGGMAFLAGVALGQPMPAGARAVAPWGSAAVAWAWAINGFASVLGSMLATGVSLFLGYTATLVVAVALYVVAAAALPSQGSRESTLLQ
jgi:hypothetical protein